MIRAKTFTELYPILIRDVLENGLVVKPRGKLVKELMCYDLCLEDPTQPIPLQKERKMNMAFSFMEAISLFFPQKETSDMLLWYVPKLDEYRDDRNGKRVWDANYGDRQTMYNQMERCKDLLKADPSTRRAIMAWFNPKHDLVDKESSDIACTISIHFMIRDGKLDCITHMRGNDILLGTPQNVFMNTFLQRVMAGWLGISIGKYYHRVNSMHAYLDDIPKLNSIMNSEGNITHLFQKMDYYGDIEQMGLLMKLDEIARSNGGKIAGGKGEIIRAKLDIKLRMVFDKVLTPYYDKRFNSKKAKMIS